LLALAEKDSSPSKIRDRWVELHPTEAHEYKGKAGTEKVKKAVASIRQFIEEQQTNADELRSLLPKTPR
jgi:hypothetical protein